MSADLSSRIARFKTDYALQRAAEGRCCSAAELLSLPYLTTGPLARQWAVRARSFEALVKLVLTPLARAKTRPLSLLDLGSGNGWLCHRAALAGYRTVALDLRDDNVDGLGAAATLHRVVASFEALPLAEHCFDVAVFNASLHYALRLRTALSEAARILRPGGTLVILDSPFYQREEAGAAMLTEKRRDAQANFGDLARTLLTLPFIEYLTRDRLEAASAGLGLVWHRHRVRYPLWYEVRPFIAQIRRRRPPSRFDLWESVVP